MATSEDMYIANLSSLLDYGDGTSKDEIEYEIFKIAFQDKETVHYDRNIGGNFSDLEQEPANLAVGLYFGSNLIEAVYYTNQEKNNEPYIVVGYDDITINNNVDKDEAYIVNVSYRLLKDLNKQGMVNI